MNEGYAETRAGKDDPKQDPKKQDPNVPDKKGGDDVSKHKEDDTKVENTAKKLTEEVKQMSWEKSNFDEFNAGSVKGVTGN